MQSTIKWLDVDPFLTQDLFKKKTNREHLSEAELNAIMSLDLKVLPRLEAVRDVFVFCCFTDWHSLTYQPSLPTRL